MFTIVVHPITGAVWRAVLSARSEPISSAGCMLLSALPPRALPTQVELEALWRPRPVHRCIGPVAPPMWLWMHDREKQAAWRKQVNLQPKDEENE